MLLSTEREKRGQDSNFTPLRCWSDHHMSQQTIGMTAEQLHSESLPISGQDGSAEAEADVEVTERSSKTSPQSFTPRSLIVGLGIGTLITFSNTYFGLQTGWISTMAMPSALIGFSIFKAFAKHLSFPFTPIENVLIQTVAGAVGTMPLGCGFVGVIPALEFLLRKGDDGPLGDGGVGEGGPLKLSFWNLVLWSLGVCLFGVVFAVPLRKEVIVREKLRFPSGTASALMLRVLHGTTEEEEKKKTKTGRKRGFRTVSASERRQQPLPEPDERRALLLVDSDDDDYLEASAARREDWRSKMRLLVGAFLVSGVYVRKFPLDYIWGARANVG